MVKEKEIDEKKKQDKFIEETTNYLRTILCDECWKNVELELPYKDYKYYVRINRTRNNGKK